ncbi:MAG: hypothetical protein K5872_16395 [Rhizobiaceae bacterium]|nr:hypothetical protein [Rhizobiaceae bacterium]MCV0407802.1 hypothetical protein [Rhizobiaceae bacterium]
MHVQNFWRMASARLRSVVRVKPDRAPAAYARDPLAHPQIAAMSPRELADLPPSQLRAWGA